MTYDDDPDRAKPAGQPEPRWPSWLTFSIWAMFFATTLLVTAIISDTVRP